MSIRRKWLQLLLLLMDKWASFAGGPINPTDIENLMHTMNDAQIEFSAPDEESKGTSDL